MREEVLEILSSICPDVDFEETENLIKKRKKIPLHATVFLLERTGNDATVFSVQYFNHKQ